MKVIAEELITIELIRDQLVSIVGGGIVVGEKLVPNPEITAQVGVVTALGSLTGIPLPTTIPSFPLAGPPKKIEGLPPIQPVGGLQINGVPFMVPPPRPIGPVVS
jgi:hypothetical protein